MGAKQSATTPSLKKASPKKPNLDLWFPVEFRSPLPTGAAKKAVETLGRRIANDVYEPEEIMPTEGELAESLDVSRGTIRDAIKVLSGKGMVRTARRYGTRVQPVSEWSLLDGDVVSWHELTHPRIKRMFSETTEMRVIVEPAAAALAAERATPEQVEKIVSAANAMPMDDGDLQSLFQADCLFHVTILDATRNSVMRQMRRLILTMLRISYEYGVIAIDRSDVNRQGHVDVADAIAARDPQSARSAMAQMLELNREIAPYNWREHDDADTG